MTLVRVDEIPNRAPTNKNHNSVVEVFDNFIASDMRYAQVIWEPYGYADIDSARASLYQARKYRNYQVNIFLRNGKLYLAKKGV